MAVARKPVVSAVPPDLRPRPKPVVAPKAKFSTYKGQVKLAPGQQLHFTAGRGYFAGPKVVRPPVRVPRGPATPVAPPLPSPSDYYTPESPDDMMAQANQEAQNQLDPQLAELRRQAQIAWAHQQQLIEGRRGFGTAAASMLAGLDYQTPYANASADVGELAKGFSDATAQRLAGVEQQNADFAASQGQESGATVDPSKVQGAMYDLNGYIPGSNLAEQGAHAAEFGLKQPGISLAVTRQDLDAMMANAIKEQDDYAQQLIQTAQQFPELADAALSKLQDYDIAKQGAALNAAGFAETQRVDTSNISNAASDNARQDQALRDNEKLAGIKTRATVTAATREFKYKYAALKLQSQKEVDAIKREEARGRQIDAAASKVRGFVVDHNGNLVLDENGKRIPVQKTSASSGTQAGALTAYQRAEQLRQANATAISLRGDPVTVNNKYAAGRYAALPGAKGKDVYKGKPAFGIPATTNNVNKAQRDGGLTFAQAQQSLMATYSLTKPKARSILVANGWKPDGKRPAPKPKPKPPAKKR